MRPSFVLPLGALGDRLGRRNVLLAGTVLFGLAALAAAFAESSSFLIACRVAMGLGAAMIMPGTLSTITSVFPPRSAQGRRGLVGVLGDRCAHGHARRWWARVCGRGRRRSS